MSCNPTCTPHSLYIKISRFYNKHDLDKYHDSIMVFEPPLSWDINSLSFTIGKIYSLITDLKNNIYFHSDYVPLKDFKSIQKDIDKILKKWYDNHHEVTLSLIKLLKNDKPQEVKNINDFIELLKTLTSVIKIILK